MDLNDTRTLLRTIVSAREGSESAFETLLEAYRPMIDGLIRQFSLDARDVFSEACMSFYRAVFSYDVEQKNVTFGLYARICVERCLIDFGRRNGKDESYVDSAVDVDKIAVSGGIQSMLEHREQTAYFLSVAKEVLSDFELDVYRYWMLGYKTSEIASALGVSAKVVDNAKNRMWKKLRQRLSNQN